MFAQQAGVAIGVQGHGIGVVGQAFVQQQQVGVPVEGNLLLAGQQQPAGLAQLLDTPVDRGGVDAVWPFAHQAHDTGTVGGMADAGGGQRAIQAHFDATGLAEHMLVGQGLGERRGSAHRADGVGAGGADAHLE